MNKRPTFTLPQSVVEDTKKYRELVERYLKGNLDEMRFKGYRVPMGVYGQRGENTLKDKYMIRVRIPGGVMTRDQLSVLNEISHEYGGGYVHFTTRQDIQIHQVNIEDTPDILERMLKFGLSSRGGGGNTVRNIMSSPYAGINPKEVFDTTPHALALTEYLIRDRSSFNLPRKYKISFSSSSEDFGLATINDLGFIAKKQKGKKGFRVFAAGGMGNQPEVGLLLDEFILEEDIFKVAEAIKRLFDAEGNRNNKHKARLRFVRKRLGDKGFVEEYKKYFEAVKKEKIKETKINNFTEVRDTLASEKVDQTPDYLYKEKEDGYYTLSITPKNGDLHYDTLKELINIIPTKYSLRTTNEQGFLIRGVPIQELSRLVRLIQKIDPDLLIENKSTMPVTCKGASTCRLGLCNSPALAEAIRDHLKKLHSSTLQLLPKIYISGCPNCCGQHLISPIGFEGKAKRHDNHLIPYYSLFLGGDISEGNSRYGEMIVDIPAKSIPSFLVELAETIKSSTISFSNFNEFIKNNGSAKIKRLAAKYDQRPTYQNNPDFYKDWGLKNDFSLAGRGPGECGTGVIDIIAMDIKQAKEAYRLAIENEDSEKLYQAITSAARSLLIVKGIDSEKDRVIFTSFKQEFIDMKLVGAEYKEVIDKAFDYKLGDINYLLDSKQKVKQLIMAIEKLFNSLNSKLEFDINPIEQEKKKDVELLDLRGVKCPINFVKAKVAISSLTIGDVLDIYLDMGEPIRNVPRSLEKEGHTILTKELIKDSFYKISVKKGE